jgi:MFS family permease
MFTAQSVANAYVSDHARVARGAASGFYLFSYYLGGSLGVQLTGILWQHAGWPAVIVACAGVALLAAAVAATVCRDVSPGADLPAEGPV